MELIPEQLVFGADPLKAINKNLDPEECDNNSSMVNPTQEKTVETWAFKAFSLVINIRTLYDDMIDNKGGKK